MYLGRDCLDNRLLDRHGKPIGHVDGIVMTIEGDAQPRVAAIEIGSVAQARRVSARFGRWAERLSRRWGKMRPNPYRIPWAALKMGDGVCRVDADAADVPGLAWEHWLRKHVIGRIPGA